MKFKILFFLMSVLLFSSCKENQKEMPKQEVQQSGDIIIDQINDAMASHPDDPKDYNARAKRYTELKAYDEAIEDYKTSLKLDSLNPDTYHKLADVYMDYYQSRRALRTMRDLLDIYPERIPSLLKIIEYQLILKQYDLALININKIAKIDPQNGEAAFMLGMVMKEKGDIRSAINAFKKATSFDSQITDAWIMLGEIYETRNDPLAETYYRNALKSNDKSISAIHSLAYYIQNNGKIEEAIDLYKSIVLIDKKYEPAYLNIGILLLEQKKYDEAIINFNILTSINPESYLSYYFKGISYEALGDIKSAKDNYQNALNFNPKYEEAQAALEALNSK